MKFSFYGHETVGQKDQETKTKGVMCVFARKKKKKIL